MHVLPSCYIVLTDFQIVYNFQIKECCNLLKKTTPLSEYTSLATGTCPLAVGFSAGSFFSSLSRMPAFSFFFFFSLAKMEDSRSGNGGISSRTVAFSEDMTRNHNQNTRWFKFKIWRFFKGFLVQKKRDHSKENTELTKTSGDATVLSFKYSNALCWISASEFLRFESLRKIWNDQRDEGT